MNTKIYASQEYVDSHIVQSDFSQNDPAAADYVKNRTHYEGNRRSQRTSQHHLGW